jgi:succinyl-CoA synthetase alpha subunit
MPGFVFKKGRVGIVSKSGTLTYEAADQIVKAGLGISTAIGIGGDPIIGTPTKDAVELLMNDPETDAIVMIGEIGGNYEPVAARWIKEKGNKKQWLDLLPVRQHLRAEGWVTPVLLLAEPMIRQLQK